VDSLRQGTLRLEELIDNLLSSASLHTGHFAVRLHATDLEAVVEEVLLTTQPLLALQRQYLKLDLPASLPLVQADPRRISQVFINLISNASKYGPPGAPIVVRVRERDNEVLVQVNDSGPGIPPEMQSALFQPFSRLDQTGRSGMGLGLSIVKAIVERHGGSVGLESAPGRGATFWFTLPLSTQPTDEQVVMARP
jgi:signal transduction histidine kinase